MGSSNAPYRGFMSMPDVSALGSRPDSASWREAGLFSGVLYQMKPSNVVGGGPSYTEQFLFSETLTVLLGKSSVQSF